MVSTEHIGRRGRTCIFHMPKRGRYFLEYFIISGMCKNQSSLICFTQHAWMLHSVPSKLWNNRFCFSTSILKLFDLEPVCTDWTMFENSWQQIGLENLPKRLVTFYAILRKTNLCKNCWGHNLGNFWKHLGNFSYSIWSHYPHLFLPKCLSV